MTVLIINLACGLCVGALLLAEKRGWRPIRALAKIAASLMFVLAALANGAPDWSHPSGPGLGVYIFAGLIFCMAGDIFLLARSRAFFLAGMAAFALGHICYIFYFVPISPNLYSVAIAAVIVYAVIEALVMRWLRPHLGDMALAVSLYALIITIMAAAAMAAKFHQDQVLWTLVAGAVGFAISDIAVAKDRFISDRFTNKFWGLPLYYGSQLLFANSV